MCLPYSTLPCPALPSSTCAYLWQSAPLCPYRTIRRLCGPPLPAAKQMFGGILQSGPAQRPEPRELSPGRSHCKLVNTRPPSKEQISLHRQQDANGIISTPIKVYFSLSYPLLSLLSLSLSLSPTFSLSYFLSFVSLLLLCLSVAHILMWSCSHSLL